MKKMSAAACVALALIAPIAALAQNVAIVNGKPVPKARVDMLAAQLAKAGRPVANEMPGRQARPAENPRTRKAGPR
jgi:peptidyl-prolyl cis-trans isomerase C